MERCSSYEIKRGVYGYHVRPYTYPFSIVAGRKRTVLMSYSILTDTVMLNVLIDLGSPPQYSQWLIFSLALLEGLPVAFCLLPDKRGRRYTELFGRIKRKRIVQGNSSIPSVSSQIMNLLYCRLFSKK